MEDYDEEERHTCMIDANVLTAYQVTTHQTVEETLRGIQFLKKEYTPFEAGMEVYGGFVEEDSSPESVEYLNFWVRLQKTMIDCPLSPSRQLVRAGVASPMENKCNGLSESRVEGIGS